jgi:hypothetical protein
MTLVMSPLALAVMATKPVAPQKSKKIKQNAMSVHFLSVVGPSSLLDVSFPHIFSIFLYFLVAVPFIFFYFWILPLFCL